MEFPQQNEAYQKSGWNFQLTETALSQHGHPWRVELYPPNRNFPLLRNYRVSSLRRSWPKPRRTVIRIRPDCSTLKLLIMLANCWQKQKSVSSKRQIQP